MLVCHNFDLRIINVHCAYTGAEGFSGFDGTVHSHSMQPDYIQARAYFRGRDFFRSACCCEEIGSYIAAANKSYRMRAVPVLGKCVIGPSCVNTRLGFPAAINLNVNIGHIILPFHINKQSLVGSGKCVFSLLHNVKIYIVPVAFITVSAAYLIVPE